MPDRVWAYRAVVQGAAGPEACRRAVLLGSDEAARRWLIAAALAEGCPVRRLTPISLVDFCRDWDDWLADNRVW